MALSGQSDGLSDSTYLFHQLDAYPWDKDEEFQGGLRAILGSVQDPAQIDHLTLRAKCYYYARKVGAQVDFDGYKRWVENGGSEAANGSLDLNGTLDISHGAEGAGLGEEGYGSSSGGGDGGMAGAPKPASFAEICDMIAEGKPIPGIKDIPDTILEGQASETQAEKRKKPWEKGESVSTGAAADREAGSGEEKLSWMR